MMKNEDLRNTFKRTLEKSIKILESGKSLDDKFIPSDVTPKTRFQPTSSRVGHIKRQQLAPPI